jgi:hypothetical protein
MLGCSSDDGGGTTPVDSGTDTKKDSQTIDTGTADTEVPDTEVPDTTIVDSGADSTTTDSTVADATDSTVADAADTAVADAADSTVTDTAVADTAVADTKVDAADSTVTDTAVADTAVADTAVADASDSGADTAETGTAAASFYVLRVGDGVAALGSGATAGFLEKHLVSDGSLVGTAIALPVTATAPQQPITFAGSSTSEGELTRSADGHFVMLAGYNAAVGTAAVTGTTAAAKRVIARINAAGTIDTSTALDTAFLGSNVRGVVSVDGTAFWAGGTASATSGGVWYTTFGATTGGTQVLAAPNNVRHIGLFGGQLYGTSASTPYFSIFSIGTGTPTMSGATATALNGLPSATGPSPYGFAILDRDSTVAGVDTAYLCDDRTVTGGGIAKWTLGSGGSWTAGFTVAPAAAIGCRGLTAYVEGSNVRILVVGTDSKVYSLLDDGTASPAATALAGAAAGTNMAYRGIALVPN